MTFLAKSPKEIFAGQEALLKKQAEMTTFGPGAIFYNFVGRVFKRLFRIKGGHDGASKRIAKCGVNRRP